MTQHVIEVDEATFQQDVLERSKAVPVVVDFWAAWCGPCRVLGPMLERLAGDADGAWVLAKVDVDRNQSLAASFGVQGIPAVHAFKDGRPVASFVGALPEAQVHAWLMQLGPSQADLLVEDAQAAEARGDVDAALAAYRRALDHEPARGEARAAIARLELERRTETADEEGFRARLEDDPGDVDAAVGLADLAFARGEIEEATDRLVSIIRSASGDQRERARAHLVELLDTLPADDTRANAARRELASALF